MVYNAHNYYKNIYNNRRILIYKGSKQVCGMTNGPPRHKETWWCNRDVEKVVAKRKVCHKTWLKSNSAEINIL